jgi:glycopeptide antibiotics resistance protein
VFRQHPVLSVTTTLYLAAVGWLTLNPSINTEESSWLWWMYVTLSGNQPTEWMTFDGIEFFINLVMFMPVGVFFVLLLGRRRWPLAVVFGVLGSCWIELAQYLWLPDRTADFRDVVSNGMGIILGVGLGLLLTSGSARRAKPATKSAVAA